MSYAVNTGEDRYCNKCNLRIGVAKGFYSQWGRVLCCDCQEKFVEFVKEKYNEFIQPERSKREDYKNKCAKCGKNHLQYSMYSCGCGALNTMET